jgi:hypothetical protein
MVLFVEFLCVLFSRRLHDHRAVGVRIVPKIRINKCCFNSAEYSQGTIWPLLRKLAVEGGRRNKVFGNCHLGNVFLLRQTILL